MIAPRRYKHIHDIVWAVKLTSNSANTYLLVWTLLVSLLPIFILFIFCATISTVNSQLSIEHERVRNQLVTDTLTLIPSDVIR